MSNRCCQTVFHDLTAPKLEQSLILRKLRAGYTSELNIVDPVSLVFSAYLNSVQSTVSNHFNESRNVDITPVVIEYEGEPVFFQHQLWQVRSSSVCATHQQNISQFSQCTVKASRLFNALCSKLKDAKSSEWKHIRVQNMYCNAATVAAMGSGDVRLARNRDRQCESYRTISKAIVTK